MAEEKKTTTRTKKVEKKFCTNCGKEIIGDEICDCQKTVEETNVKPVAAPVAETQTGVQSQPINVNTDAMAKLFKRFINTILNMFVRPSSTVKSEVENPSIGSSMLILGAIALTYGLTISVAFSSIISLISLITGGISDVVISIPYVKIFFIMSIVKFGLDFIPITCAFLVAKITKCREFTYKKAISLYATSMAPMIFANLANALFSLTGILSFIGSIASAIVSMFTYFNFILGFVDTTKVKDDAKSYAVTGMMMLSTIISGIITVLVVIFMIAVLFSSLFMKVENSIGHYSNSDSYYNDNSFDW